jgi:hypothetical protein
MTLCAYVNPVRIHVCVVSLSWMYEHPKGQHDFSDVLILLENRVHVLHVSMLT